MVKIDTVAVWRKPPITMRDWQDSVDHSVLCLVEYPDGKGGSYMKQVVAPLDYTASGRCFFCINDGIVRAWAHLPYPPRRGFFDDDN
jgi:hypothetical protein